MLPGGAVAGGGIRCSAGWRTRGQRQMSSIGGPNGPDGRVPASTGRALTIMALPLGCVPRAGTAGAEAGWAGGRFRYTSWRYSLGCRVVSCRVVSCRVAPQGGRGGQGRAGLPGADRGGDGVQPGDQQHRAGCVLPGAEGDQPEPAGSTGAGATQDEHGGSATVAARRTGWSHPRAARPARPRRRASAPRPNDGTSPPSSPGRAPRRRRRRVAGSWGGRWRGCSGWSTASRSRTSRSIDGSAASTSRASDRHLGSTTHTASAAVASSRGETLMWLPSVAR